MTLVTLSTGTSWTVPAGVTRITVVLIGGGAGGNGGRLIAGENFTGWGGNQAIPVTTANIDVTPGSTINYSLGAGGIGGIACLTAGCDNRPVSTGGTTTFEGATPAQVQLSSLKVHAV